MLQRPSCLVPLLLLTLVAVAQEAPRFEPKQLQQDFRILRSALEEGHSGIYRYTKKPDLDAIFDAAARMLDRPMDALEFYRIAAPAVAAVKCGHTQVAPPQDLLKSMGASLALFPFSVEVLDGKVYVYRDYATPGGKLAGREIRSVNGIAIDRILSTMTAAASGDGNIPTSRAWRIGRGRGFQRGLYPLLGIQSPFRVTLRSGGAKEESLDVDGILSAKLQEIAKERYPSDQRKDYNAEFRFEDGGKIAVLTVYGFGGTAGDPRKPLAEYFPDVFRQIREKGSTALVLDVRNNGGGADALGKQLFSFLWDEPFRYYDDLIINARTFAFKPYMERPRDIPADAVEHRADGKYHPVKHPNLGVQQPSQPHFAGKVFILINGGSFSATCEFASIAHFHKRAKFIGEEGAGGYYGNTSGLSAGIALPNTKVQANIPLQTYYMSVSGYKQADRGVMPDYPVRNTIADLLAGKDRAMEMALRLARQ